MTNEKSDEELEETIEEYEEDEEIEALEEPVEEKKEEPKETPIITPIETKANELEKPCDPMKMNCDELGNHIITLVDKRGEYTSVLKKLDEVKKIIPSKDLDKLYSDTTKEKQAIDDSIYLVAERAIACRTFKPEDKDTKQVEQEK